MKDPKDMTEEDADAELKAAMSAFSSLPGYVLYGDLVAARERVQDALERKRMVARRSTPPGGAK